MVRDRFGVSDERAASVAARCAGHNPDSHGSDGTARERIERRRRVREFDKVIELMSISPTPASRG